MNITSLEDIKAVFSEFNDKNTSVTLFSPYIKLSALREINKKNTIRRIIVRWELNDIINKSCDFLDLYKYCKENRITLYRNTRIHLKVLWNNYDELILGSANITNNGLAMSLNHNFEFCSITSNLNFNTLKYFNDIIQLSQYVDEKLIKKISELTSGLEEIRANVPEDTTLKITADKFLISTLPMFRSPREIFKAYKDPSALTIDEKVFLSHDLANYNIPSGLSEDDFNNMLKTNFNSHPFISSFKNAVKNHIAPRGNVNRNHSMNFGSVKKWFQINTTTVPTPRGHELTDLTNVLYTWICFFDPLFTHSIEGRRSDIIRYNSVFV